ncbi:DUF3574 domain-containing protein [Sorangium sp. So ce448]|uniref:DUF3574 domain-containing protein n=1 Tax=Sorangium sp. So ce448 TaxID=3133314 RepID=UPI003F5E92CD
MRSRTLPRALLAVLLVTPLATPLATTACHGARKDAAHPSPGRAGAACGRGDPMTRTELFFGLDRFELPPVTQAEWQQFVDTAITPRFKDGLTQFDVDGQYLATTGKLIREDSRLIMLLHDGGQVASDAIDAIRKEYKVRFNQESVLRIDEPVCVGF